MTSSYEFNRRGFLAASAASLGLGAAVGGLRAEAVEAGPWRPTTERKMRIGVVGGGFGASFHWHEHPNCVVEAVSDLIPGRRKHLMRRYGCETSYESLEELVYDEAIDAVAVFTPAPDHVRHTQLCFEHGKHVISACPACMSLEEAAQLKEAKEASGLKYMTAETSYFRPESITMRRLVADGVLGQLVYTEAEYYHPGIGRDGDGLSWRDGQKTWRYGFPPMLYPTHTTAFLVGVTGERLTKVSCVGTSDPDEPAMRDNRYGNPFLNGTAMFTTSGGNAFKGNVGWNVQAHGERAQWFGRAGSFYMPTSAGQPFSIHLPGRPDIHELPDYFHLLPPDMRYDSGHGASHPHITHEFVMAVLEDREPATDVYEALAYAVPGVVAHESSFKDGEQLEIPQFDSDA